MFIHNSKADDGHIENSTAHRQGEIAKKKNHVSYHCLTGPGHTAQGHTAQTSMMRVTRSQMSDSAVTCD
jgi:hypothetical protein